MPKVSVIVPTYNYAHFLPRCLDSLVNQTLHDIEIIIVDDCSTDSTAEVVKPYLTDSRVKYIKNEVNQKLYASRIVGMKAASGSYIAHCDADDLYELQAMQLMYGHAEKTGADIVDTNFIENKYCRTTTNPGWKGFILEGRQILPALYHSKMKISLCSALFSKRVVDAYLKEAPLSAVSIGEDFFAKNILCYHAQVYAYLPAGLYQYRFNNDSISECSTVEKATKILTDHILLISLIHKFFTEKGLINEFSEEFNLWKSMLIVHTFRLIYGNSSDEIKQVWASKAPLEFQTAVWGHFSSPYSVNFKAEIQHLLLRLLRSLKFFNKFLPHPIVLFTYDKSCKPSVSGKEGESA